MKIVPLAFDSMGVRSMATFVETKDVSITIDPGVALGPRRYGLPPHPLEIQQMDVLWETVKSHVEKSDIVAVTHYHYDHHNPKEPEILKTRRILLKHPEKNINFSQKRRARYFLSLLDRNSVGTSDGARIVEGNTIIEFSNAVPHGTDSKLGYVTMVFVDDGSGTFVHTSDVEGASLEEQINWLLKKDAEIVVMDGPMTYMLGYRYSHESLNRSIENLERLMQGNLKVLVIDHHLTRDLKWRDNVSEVFDKARDYGVKVLSAAEFAGLRENLLEARRRELYEMDI
ncbi:hypothetical protein [Geoglobus acetivorans]